MIFLKSIYIIYNIKINIYNILYIKYIINQSNCSYNLNNKQKKIINNKSTINKVIYQKINNQMKI